MFCLSAISPLSLVIIGGIFTFLISSEDRSAGELNVMGNLIVAVGSLILTVAAQEEFLKSEQNQRVEKEDIMKQVEKLRLKCEKLEQKAK